jgi:hypothetical protein
MLIRETEEFKKVILESASYHEAFGELSNEFASELNDIIDDIMDESEDDLDYDDAFNIYKEELENIYGDVEGLEWAEGD